MDTTDNLDRLVRSINSRLNKKLRLFVIAMTACQDSQVTDSPEEGFRRNSLTVDLATTYSQANSPEEAQQWAEKHYRQKKLASDGWSQYHYTVEEIPLAFVEEFLKEKGYRIEPPPLE